MVLLAYLGRDVWGCVCDLLWYETLTSRESPLYPEGIAPELIAFIRFMIRSYHNCVFAYIYHYQSYNNKKNGVTTDVCSTVDVSGVLSADCCTVQLYRVYVRRPVRAAPCQLS